MYSSTVCPGQFCTGFLVPYTLEPVSITCTPVERFVQKSGPCYQPTTDDQAVISSVQLVCEPYLFSFISYPVRVICSHSTFTSNERSTQSHSLLSPYNHSLQIFLCKWIPFLFRISTHNEPDGMLELQFCESVFARLAFSFPAGRCPDQSSESKTLFTGSD